MTLTLADPSQFLKHTADFSEIPDTLIIFLKRLKRMSISMHPNDSQDDSEIVERRTYRYDESNGQGRLTKVSSFDELAYETTLLYRVTRKLLTDLPSEPARTHTNQAEVVLAFPIDSQSRPIIEQQDVFAFLPLCRAGFSVSQS